MNYMYCEVYSNNIYINSACLGARVTVETPEKTIVLCFMFVNKRYTITVYQRAIQGYNNLILQNYKDWHLF